VNIPEGFLEDTSETGRVVIVSQRTGKMYAWEPVGNPRTNWGDVDPATKETTGSYGTKYRGSIPGDSSMITEKNGFIKISFLKPGQSPIKAIQEIDAKYPDKA
jgi:hypothetical protein